MHGRNLASETMGTSALRSPPPVLPGCGSKLRCASALRPDRSLPLDAAFHSPAAKSHLAANPRSRVNAPGLHLRDRASFSVGPFGFALPASSGFLSPDGVRSSRVARCQLPIPALSVWPRTAAPLQDFSILRDHSAPPDSMRKSLPLRVARSAVTPRRVAIINYYSATDQRSSSATSRLARYPLNLLEPMPSCA